jgi:5-methylthioadenosine/S-adenosylhomocysteine deaminase
VRSTAPVVLPGDPGCTVLRDAAVDVVDGRITGGGPLAGAPPPPGAVRELTGVLLPGLVNTHCHTPMLLLRGLGGDLPLLRWLHEVMWPAEGRLTASDVRAGMVSGCVELLRTGTTTSVEMYFFTDAVIDAVLAVGSRVLLTPGVIATPGWDRLGSWEAMRNAVSRRIDARGLRSGPAERVELGYGPHAAYTLPAEALRSVAEHARDRGALLHLHLAETLEEDAALRAEHGSVPAMLDRLGVLGGRVLAAHRGAPQRRRHRAAGRPRRRGGALPRLEREAGGRGGPDRGAAPGGRAGGAGHGRPGVRRRPRPVGPDPARRPPRPGDQR